MDEDDIDTSEMALVGGGGGMVLGFTDEGRRSVITINHSLSSSVDTLQSYHQETQLTELDTRTEQNSSVE